ncbi:MAG: TonB-dependent receptor [Tannerella sp.]|jgi:iron complex outermembrane receptor protein|nr:TonB-dependent receptor [Tannerella sp.]
MKFKKIILFLLVTHAGSLLHAQNRFTAVVKDAGSGEPLYGATAVVEGFQAGSISDENGVLTIESIPNGNQTIHFSFLGYEPQEHAYVFPLATADTVVIRMEVAAGEELEEVMVTTTRSTRTIQHLPTRVEFIGAEELEEKANMKPGDIRMLLSESTGIQTQQTSPTSANASIRIQGLDGRYTQLLKDGLPLYSGAASGLGLLQIPPLDLKQVEIVKGSSSTLYGGGAIAGLVNLISKTPGVRPELSFLLNGTSAGGLDVSGFYSRKYRRTGLTLFAARNSNAAYDPSGNRMSAIPKFERYTVNPRFFVYLSGKTSLDAGLNTTFEDRLGGDMEYIRGKGSDRSGYFERNRTERVSAHFSLSHAFPGASKLNLRSSYSHFHRLVAVPGYVFDGTQGAAFGEVNCSFGAENMEWVTGANLWIDRFSEKQNPLFPVRDYRQATTGLFVQNLARATDWFSLETGLRGDYVADYGFALLPRLSGLFRIGSKWTSRIGGGLGYKTPTIFTEESERLHFRNVQAVSSERNRLERSYGLHADVNYRTLIREQVMFSINHLFFYTRLRHPLLLIPQADDSYQFRNIDGHTDTRGIETNAKIGYSDFTLFLGYTLTDATVNNAAGDRYQNPLTPRHRLNAILMFEVEDKWKAGLEAYYNSRQSLSDGTEGEACWVFGAMAERIWEHFSVYANFENFTDTRQTRFGSIYSGSIASPVFKDIYAPLDGFVVNMGLKLKF